MFDWQTGEGFIFVMGAPGSRWSGLCRLIALAEESDNSDESPSDLSRHCAAMSHRMGFNASPCAEQVSSQLLIYLANSCGRYWRNLNNGFR